MNLQTSRCLVVGAGNVGLRKITALVKAHAMEILVVEPKLCELPKYSGIIHKRRTFEEKDLATCVLVFAATNDRALNSKIATLCRARNILCNVADLPDEGNFVVPCHFSSNSLDLAVGTKGASPAMAARICKEIGKNAVDKYEPAIRFMAKARPLILRLESSATEKKRILVELAASRLTECLSLNKTKEAEQLLRALLPESLHNKIGDLLHDDQ